MDVSEGIGDVKEPDIWVRRKAGENSRYGPDPLVFFRVVDVNEM